MEYWSDGVEYSTIPLLKYSTTHILHHSHTPILRDFSGKLAGDFAFHCLSDGFRTGAYMEFGVDIMEMESDRVGANEEFFPNRFVGMSFD